MLSLVILGGVMNINISKNKEELGKRAARFTAICLNDAISKNGEARLLLSTGQSQFETLKHLVKEDVDFSKVTMFHLDEYIGIDSTHKASFKKYLTDRFVCLVSLKESYLIDGVESIEIISEKFNEKDIDVALIGIGENCHIAFNDPPADFNTNDVFKIVTLDEKCRLQQVREGWFSSIEEVPKQAISMSVKAIMRSRIIISAVPNSVKSDAVYHALNESVSANYPASILKRHSNWNLFLDEASASKVVNFN